MNGGLRDLFATKSMPIRLNYVVPCERAELTDSVSECDLIPITALRNAMVGLHVMQTKNWGFPSVINLFF